MPRRGLELQARGARVSPLTHMTHRPHTVGAVLLLLTTGCTTATPQTAFNPHSDYAIVELDLFQVIIVMGVAIGVLVDLPCLSHGQRYSG
jgi:hypothetical protein